MISVSDNRAFHRSRLSSSDDQRLVRLTPAEELLVENFRCACHNRQLRISPKLTRDLRELVQHHLI